MEWFSERATVRPSRIQDPCQKGLCEPVSPAEAGRCNCRIGRVRVGIARPLRATGLRKKGRRRQREGDGYRSTHHVEGFIRLHSDRLSGGAAVGVCRIVLAADRQPEVCVADLLTAQDLRPTLAQVVAQFQQESSMNVAWVFRLEWPRIGVWRQRESALEWQRVFADDALQAGANFVIECNGRLFVRGTGGVSGTLRAAGHRFEFL